MLSEQLQNEEYRKEYEIIQSEMDVIRDSVCRYQNFRECDAEGDNGGYWC